MNDANFLLFESTNEKNPLFKNHLELVTLLLDTKESPYYTDQTDKDKYYKAQSRLKTYISQLLSSATVRSITEDLKKGLITIISNKLPESSQAEELTNLIIKSLREKNSSPLKQESKSSIVEEFINSFKSGSYIAIITPRPLEVEARINPEIFSLRKIFFEDFLENLLKKDHEPKYYRFNFPVESSGVLFWKGLKKVLIRKLSEVNYEDLFNKFTLSVETLTKIQNNPSYSEEHMKEIADEILTKLNNDRHILVFTCPAPIFSLPIIAINPAEVKNSRIYSLHDSDANEPTIYKFNNENIVLWRLFVWDRMKSKQFASSNLNYSDA